MAQSRRVVRTRLVITGRGEAFVGEYDHVGSDPFQLRQDVAFPRLEDGDLVVLAGEFHLIGCDRAAITHPGTATGHDMDANSSHFWDGTHRWARPVVVPVARESSGGLMQGRTPRTRPVVVPGAAAVLLGITVLLPLMQRPIGDTFRLFRPSLAPIATIGLVLVVLAAA